MERAPAQEPNLTLFAFVQFSSAMPGRFAVNPCLRSAGFISVYLPTTVLSVNADQLSYGY